LSLTTKWLDAHRQLQTTYNHLLNLDRAWKHGIIVRKIGGVVPQDGRPHFATVAIMTPVPSENYIRQY
jgi:hypothetical protein